MSNSNECCIRSLDVQDNEVPGVIGNLPCTENSEASGEDNTQCKSENEFCSVGNSIHNHPSHSLDETTVPPSLTHNTVNGNASNMIPYEPISEQSDTKFLKELESNSDNVKVQHASTSTNKYRINNSGDENIQDENEIDQENSLYTSNKETSDGLSSEMKKCNEPKLQIKIHKNESGYKSKTRISQNDNRVTYINKDNIGKTIDYSYFIRNFQREESIVPNVKSTKSMTDAIKAKMKSATSRQEGDIYEEGLFDADQPKTFREWYQYTEQIKAYASARVKSGAVKLRREHDNILVLDISERMAEYFQQMKSAALQYVYGIKEIAECGGNENGIGLAVFGRQTRLIQEATIDFELIIELIRQLRPDGDASIIAGLLMGYAGVSACKVSRIQDVVIRAHMIVFTNGSSDQCSFSAESKKTASINDKVSTDIDCIIDEITSTTTKIFYVPIGGDQCNSILKQVVRKTNGKTIPDNEMNRLIRMSRVMQLAVNISSDIRYLKNQSRDDIKKIISNLSNVPDTHDDCLDMVQDFSNPIKYFNNQGLYTDIKRNTLKLGDRVRRGPDWTNDDQDLGLPGTVIGQKRDNWSLTKECVLVEWDHGRIFSYLYDEQKNKFKIKKVNEPRILANEMIAVGCRVVRGLDWKYGDHDGGIGTLGTVLDLSTERTVVVIWDSKNVGLYRFGFKGLFEVKLCGDLSNSMPYEQTKKSVYSEQKFKNKEPGNYRNTSETMITNERDKENYLFPLYSDTSVSAIWEYQNSLQWTKYPSGINVKIEKAYQRKKSGKIIIEMDRTTYIVNFSKMTQENANNKTEMAVRRKD
ncbi:uncharacterized protein LOC127734538 [Mytilus californianus]|uniref:uncharacterized protein LOC127734538 n=1 Tax=Mytilus californianus TaxID=6549 RepID=UPI0022476F2C|nr:uncharacterized protein LOC127734538 [Mytilus californianus]